MTKQAINVGTTANDKKGDSLRAAFQKVNANFTELYEAVGLAATGQDTALTFLGSTLSTDDSSSIVIDRATTVTSNLSVGGDIVPQTANGGDLGSSTLPWRSLYVSNNTIYIGGTAVGLDANGNLTTGGTVVGSTPAWANITGKPTFATVATTGAYADLTGKPTIPTLVSQLANDSGFLTSVGNISNIQSESDVSIQVNLTDSTTRIWRFGEDGNLAVPGDINLSGGTISQYSQNGLTGLKLVANADQGQNVTIMGTGNNTFPILNYVGTTLSGITIGTPEGDWNFMNGNLTIPGDIKSNGNINIEINLADSTLRRWSFGEDGDTVFPNNVSINYSGNNVQFPRIIADSGKAFSVQGQGNTGSTALSWTVDPDAASQYAAVSVSRAGGDNLAKVVLQAQSNSGDAGTAKTWKFDQAGTLTLPNGSVIKDTDGYAVAIGVAAGSSNQGSLAVAVGAGAGYTGQGTSAVAIGRDAGGTAQGINAVAIGDAAGGTAQGINAVAIGIQAGYANQAANSIIINATGATLNQTVANTFTVKPVRQGETADAMYYNSSTGEITYAGAFSFSVAADDSTQRSISSGELVKFIGAGGITTSSDAEGYITITGSGGSVSSLVNGAYTVSLGSTGTLTLPADGIITAPINQEFQLQAKDANSVLRNEINLDPNNGTYMSVWSDETTSFSSADWGSGSWNNEGGLGAARFTNAQALQNFWTTGIGSLGLPIEASINGGARTPNVFYDNNNGETYGVFLGLDAVPPGGQGTTVPITTLVFYYRLQSKINMDVTGNEILVDAQAMDLDLRTTLNLDLRANENLNLRGLGAYPVRIYTNNNTHMWEFDNTGTLTFPDNTVQSTAWTGTVSQLRNEGNINIDINLSDSTLRRWQFGEDGSLTLPSVGKINNGEYDWTFGSDGNTTFPGDIKGTANTSIIVDNVVLFANVTVAQAQPYGPSGSRVFISVSAYPTLGSIVQVGDTVTIGWGNPITVTITNILGGGDVWELRFNQIITAELILNPGTITITSAQVNTWTFDNDGGLTFPDGTVQTTAWTGTFSTLSVTGAVTAERFNTDQITVVGNRISTTVTNANLELECNGSGGVVINAIADATTASTVKSVGYLGLPQSATTTSGTLAMSDAGKHIYVTTNGQAISIPDNSLVAYPIGTTLTFIAGPSATTVLIVINTDTLRLAGSSSTGTRTLAANGMATAVKVASTLWYINGIGLT